MAKNKTFPADDVLLTDQVAADRLGVSLATIRRMRRDGELAFVRVRLRDYADLPALSSADDQHEPWNVGIVRRSA